MPDARAPEFRCDTPDSITPLPFGRIVGADATKLYVRGADGVLRTWAKAGGPLVELSTQDLPQMFVVSGGRYYWWSAPASSLVVTDENGTLLDTAQLSATTSVLIDVAPAPDDGAYIHSQCQENGLPCTPASHAIELLHKNSTVAQTLVTSSYPIHAMAAGIDELIWMEILQANEVSIRKWQRSTGVVTTLVPSIQGVDSESATLAVKVPGFYVGSNSAEGSAIQQRSIETGLITTYQLGSGPPPYHLRVADNAYWTEPPGILTGPFCVPKRGLISMPLTGVPLTRTIDIDAYIEPIHVDQSRVFYYSGMPDCCWSSGSIICDSSSHELRCYHK